MHGLFQAKINFLKYDLFLMYVLKSWKHSVFFCWLLADFVLTPLSSKTLALRHMTQNLRTEKYQISKHQVVSLGLDFSPVNYHAAYSKYYNFRVLTLAVAQIEALTGNW